MAKGSSSLGKGAKCGSLTKGSKGGKGSMVHGPAQMIKKGK